jgi:hypothetical protein
MAESTDPIMAKLRELLTQSKLTLEEVGQHMG